MNTRLIAAATLVVMSGGISSMAQSAAQPADPLPSWNEGEAKQSILTFVSTVTRKDSSEFVPPADRIATFDNDGTLWAEQPLYFQIQFGIDRVKELAHQHPEWKEKEPFKSVLAGDLKTALAGGAPALIQLLAAASSDMTPDEFYRVVNAWIAKARHPKTGQRYGEMVYGRCSSCSSTFGPTDSRPTSCREAAPIS